MTKDDFISMRAEIKRESESKINEAAREYIRDNALAGIGDTIYGLGHTMVVDNVLARSDEDDVVIHYSGFDQRSKATTICELHYSFKVIKRSK